MILTLLSLRSGRRERTRLVKAMTSWRGLVALSAGLSVDNLVVGFGLGLGGVSPLALAVSGVALIGLAIAAALGWL